MILDRQTVISLSILAGRQTFACRPPATIATNRDRIRFLHHPKISGNIPLRLLRNVTECIVTMKTVTTRIPEDDEEALSELEEELTADRSEVLRRLIREGLTHWRKQKALDQLRDHNITLRRAAELAEIPYVEMLSLAAEEGIETGYTTDDLERDLDRI